MANTPNLHRGHRQRMKDRFLQDGLDSFTDHQLLELLLFYSVPRRDTNPLAHRLLNHFQSLSGLLNASVEQLEAVDGVTENTAVLLHLLPQLFRRYHAEVVDPDRRVCTIKDVADYLRPYFFAAREELVFLVSMDDAGRILGCDQLDQGDVNHAHISARKLAMCALERKATGVVLAHCHPIGSNQPSAEDCLTTKHCAKILKALNIQLIDHLIFADDDWVSMGQLHLI